MPGRGPAPKPDDRRARRNKDEIPGTPLRFVRAVQPALPPGVRWHARTRQWWAMWGASPQAEHFMATDWDFLIDTALMHHAMWSKKQWTLAAEVRLRVGKFGATPEDRARLRMQFASADEADSRRPPAPSSRERYGNLRILQLPGADKSTARPRKAAAKKAPAKRTAPTNKTADAKKAPAKRTAPAKKGTAPSVTSPAEGAAAKAAVAPSTPTRVTKPARARSR